MELNKKISLFIALFALSSFSQSPLKYWVSFTDKNGTPYSLENPGAFLSQKSIDRRNLYRLNFHSTDLPLNPDYLAQLSAIQGVTLRYASKWLNGALILISNTAPLTQVNALPFVSRSVKVRLLKPKKLPEAPENISTLKQSEGTKTAAFDYGGSGSQIRQLNLDCLHNLGYRGEGMTIAICDAGFSGADGSPFFDSLRNERRLLGTRDFVHGGTSVYNEADHGTMVLSTLAANKPGTAIGTAPKASYWLLRSEFASSETISEEYNWVRAAEFADSVGVDVLTTSLGYTEFDGGENNHTYASLNGRTAPMSIAANLAARKGILVFNAAGNEGCSNPANCWYYIGVPADADSICAVGAVDTFGQKAGFSSNGPTPDGRIKPDLAACGRQAWVCTTGCFPGDGTSFACPIMAGAATCFWQRHRWMNNIEVPNALKNHASQSTHPDNSLGWGIPNTCQTIQPPDIEFDFFVYPSPSVTRIKLDINRLVFDFVEIEITDLLGKVVFNSRVAPDQYVTIFNSSGLCEGIYIARVKTSLGTKAKKFMNRKFL
jgi:serine protease AprX